MNRIVCKLKDTEKQMAEINRAFGLLNEAKDKLFKLYIRTNYVLEDAPAAASDEENPTVCEQLKECLKEAIIRQNRNAEDGDFIEAIKGQSECKVLAQALSDLGCETEITFTRGHTLCYTARIREARAKQPAITGIEIFSAKYMNKIYEAAFDANTAAHDADDNRNWKNCGKVAGYEAILSSIGYFIDTYKKEVACGRYSVRVETYGKDPIPCKLGKGSGFDRKYWEDVNRQCEEIYKEG